MHTLASSSGSNGGNAVAGFFIILGYIVAYFVPTIVALARKVPSRGSVVVVNFLLGWTIVGWIVALAMACRSRPQPQYLVPPGWGPQGGWTPPPGPEQGPPPGPAQWPSGPPSP